MQGPVNGVIANGSGYTNILYTRVGNFYMDQNGYIVNAEGKYVVGDAADGTLSIQMHLDLVAKQRMIKLKR